MKENEEILNKAKNICADGLEVSDMNVLHIIDNDSIRFPLKI